MPDLWGNNNNTPWDAGDNSHVEEQVSVEEVIDPIAEEVEVVEETEDTEEKYLDPGRSDVDSRDYDLTWGEAESVVSFSFGYQNLSDKDRKRFSSLVMGAKNDSAHPVDVARALYPSGGFVDSLDQFSTIASKYEGGNEPSFMDGLDFQRYIAESDSGTLRVFCNIANAFSNEEAPELTYRANMDMGRFIGSVVEVLKDGISEEGRESAKKIGDLLQIWPLQVA